MGTKAPSEVGENLEFVQRYLRILTFDSMLQDDMGVFSGWKIDEWTWNNLYVKISFLGVALNDVSSFFPDKNSMVRESV